ncbi:MAG: hypothetical protein JJ900_16855 [Rhodospirillales bacterium]|nr:hypothetical protein [Rhodospirillales bacterium]MBO6788519.1 hypothetical protein [Rhodospirillales bacterium]
MKVGKVAILLGVSVLSVAAFHVFDVNERILQTLAPDEGGLVIQLLLPPDDLYHPLSEQRLDLANGNAIETPPFRHKYLGRYEVALMFEKPLPAIADRWTAMNHAAAIPNLEIELANDGDKILTHSVVTVLPLSGSAGKGLSIYAYSAPEDVALDRDYEWRLVIGETDANVLANYGPAKLVVKKMSDL